MDWYSVPGFTSIEVNEQGVVRSSTTKRIRKLAERYDRPSTNKRRRIDIKEPGQKKTKIFLARAVLSAKLMRPLESWEDACHLNGIPDDNRMSNLAAGCRLNNIIDELESGRIKTSEAELDRAIERLVKMKNTPRGSEE